MNLSSHAKALKIPALQERQGHDREFIYSADLRNDTYAGQNGFFVKVRLTSYRSLPLSCIENIEISIDGQPVDKKDITFILNGYAHKVEELCKLSHLWWFILDVAELFIVSPVPLSEGDHLVDGLLVTVEPYVSGGRFTFFYPSQKRLAVTSGL